MSYCSDIQEGIEMTNVGPNSLYRGHVYDERLERDNIYHLKWVDCRTLNYMSQEIEYFKNIRGVSWEQTLFSKVCKPPLISKIAWIKSQSCLSLVLQGVFLHDEPFGAPHWVPKIFFLVLFERFHSLHNQVSACQKGVQLRFIHRQLWGIRATERIQRESLLYI